MSSNLPKRFMCMCVRIGRARLYPAKEYVSAFWLGRDKSSDKISWFVSIVIKIFRIFWMPVKYFFKFQKINILKITHFKTIIPFRNVLCDQNYIFVLSNRALNHTAEGNWLSPWKILLQIIFEKIQKKQFFYKKNPIGSSTHNLFYNTEFFTK